MNTKQVTINCTQCRRPIEECACCNELDCPPPICDHCLTEALLRSIRPQFVHRGASMTSEESEHAGAGAL